MPVLKLVVEGFEMKEADVAFGGSQGACRRFGHKHQNNLSRLPPRPGPPPSRPLPPIPDENQDGGGQSADNTSGVISITNRPATKP